MMRILRTCLLAVAVLAAARTSSAQKTGTIELGVFAHYTAVSGDTALGSSSAGFGARGGIFFLRWLEAEWEYGRGSVDNGGLRYPDGHWSPTRIILAANLPLRPRTKLVLGAGTVDTYEGDITHNEFEEGISVLAGLRFCVGDAWSIRPELMFDRLPDPAEWMQRSFLAEANGATSTRWGFRIGVSRFIGRGARTCAENAPAPAAPAPRPAPAPPPVVTPPVVTPPVVTPPPPPPAPTANVSVSPTAITAGQSTTLTWSSTNATRCTAPWMTGTPASGSQSVSPAANTTYTITCEGAGGTRTASATVNVTQPPPPTPPPAAPPPRAPPPRELFRLSGVNFELNKATLTTAGQAKLDSAVTILKQLADARVEVQGHTDSTGVDAYNMSLSEKRAIAVRDYLVSKGIAASRLTAKGYGETQPVADNGTRAGRAENRRVVLVEIKS